MRTLRDNTLLCGPAFAFIALYLLLDWATYLDPLHGLNITPWNPDPALGMVFWLRYGRRAAAPWFVALLAGEVLVRGMPAGWAVTVLGALWLTLAYGAIGEALRRRFSGCDMFDNSHGLFAWVAIIVGGTVVNALGYVSLLAAAGLVLPAEWTLAVWRFGVGDMVGLVVSMPLIWMLASAPGRARLRERVLRWETPAVLALSVAVLWLVFGFIAGAEFKHFYFLFLPLIWAASRQGVYGAALIVFALQAAVVALLKWSGAANIAVAELQMLDAVMALVGFFIGIAVDERRQAADDLKHTLRLAAAGEMAAALAHELNQPLTALAAYGKACEHLIEHGDRADLLKGTIGRMVVEAGRAADVVRRLRDFFRTGAMRLETVDAAALVSFISQQFFDALREHGVELAVDVGETAAALLLSADRLQLELVLRNLLANALDAVKTRPAGARRIRIALARLDGERLQLSVEDSGDGVSAALAARLFEPFVSSKASGMGLGLVLSRAIAEAHGGQLRAEVAGHGIFRLTLPALPAAAHGL
ncbi:ATP-binding protein [Rugamonas sp.]|uniref:ATP-binding protein n=1 Tax=Rugamonas sp. TaxID=1926287 RepID=UPI0025F21B1A|nr:ATP-binding protein [Rugamonas sp.]